MEMHFCPDAVEDAIATHGKPEIMNTDNGKPVGEDLVAGYSSLEDSPLAAMGGGRVRIDREVRNSPNWFCIFRTA